MSYVSLWSLLGFLTWTMLLVVLGIGIPRVSAIVAGRAEPRSFVADVPHGGERYRRTLRAHANCVENLGIFAALVLSARFIGLNDPTFEVLAAVVLPARVLQSTIHVASGSNRAVVARFACFVVQLLCFAAMTLILARVLARAA